MQKFLAQGVYDEKETMVLKVFDKLPLFEQENAQVFFEITIGN